jgi:hypothetical protein
MQRDPVLSSGDRGALRIRFRIAVLLGFIGLLQFFTSRPFGLGRLRFLLLGLGALVAAFVGILVASATD